MNGKLGTDSNNNNIPSRSSELVRKLNDTNNNDLIFISLLNILKNLTSPLVRLGEERKVTMEEFGVLLFMATIIGSLLFAIWFNHFLFEIGPFVRAWGRKNISKIWDRLKRIVKR